MALVALLALLAAATVEIVQVYIAEIADVVDVIAVTAHIIAGVLDNRIGVLDNFSLYMGLSCSFRHRGSLILSVRRKTHTQS